MMKDIPSNQGPHLPREVQRKRLARAIEGELTERQRCVVLGYYFEHKNIIQLAQELGVNKSTVWRTLKRGEQRLHRCLRY